MGNRKNFIIGVILLTGIMSIGGVMTGCASGKTDVIKKSETETADLNNEKQEKEKNENLDKNDDRKDDENKEDKTEVNQSLEYTQVNMDYLKDALFIGDSRTSTLYEYAAWENTTFFVEYGLNIWSVMDSKIVTDEETGAKITVDEALEKKQYPKIYIMLGVNELGTGNPETFCKKYKTVLDRIRKKQPDSIIFVQSIIHVTDDKDKEGTYINNREINRRNEKLKTLADNEKIFYLNLNEIFDGSDNKLNRKYTSDGVHIMPNYIDMWTDFYLHHGIVL